MSEYIPPFNENSRCEKCGSDDIASQYKPKDGRDPRFTARRLEQECISRHCRRCHWSWVERPLDCLSTEELCDYIRQKEFHGWPKESK